MLYEDNHKYTIPLVLPAGPNKLILIDDYGNGWGVGYGLQVGNASVENFATATDLDAEWTTR
eukprot:SAG31_NODE_23536_length_502_cov_0.868486_1_plen_61_part_01